MPDIVIREAIPEDIPQILHIYSSAGVGEVHFSVEEATVHYDRLKQYPAFHLYIAFIDQNAAGTYELLIMDNMAKRGRRSGIVERCGSPTLSRNGCRPRHDATRSRTVP